MKKVFFYLPFIFCEFQYKMKNVQAIFKFQGMQIYFSAFWNLLFPIACTIFLRSPEYCRQDLCFGLWSLASLWPAFYLYRFYIGDEAWPTDLKLKFVKGQNFCHGETIMLTPAEPQQTIELRINMIAPSQDGLYQGQWRGVTLNGAYFGSK